MAVEPKNRGFFSQHLYFLTQLRYFEVLLSLIMWGHEIKWRSGHTISCLHSAVIGKCIKLIVWHLVSLQWYNILTKFREN